MGKNPRRSVLCEITIGRGYHRIQPREGCIMGYNLWKGCIMGYNPQEECIIGYNHLHYGIQPIYCSL